MTRGATRALIWGGGGVYSYIRVLPDEFLLKSVVFKFISKEISRAENEYMNTAPPSPTPINALATPNDMLKLDYLLLIHPVQVGCPIKGATIQLQIQISALIQTTLVSFCIQFQKMQFHMIRSFSSCPRCIKLCVFVHS